MKIATLLLLITSAARATTFYLTVAGLGGEPDYEQRFSMWAAEIEAVLKSAAGDSQIETLKGAAATRANVRAALEKIASQAKPDDALVVMLIGHGSFDGFDYKINLPGPDLSAAELARFTQSRSCVAPARGQHDQRQRRRDERAAEGESRRYHRH